MPRLPDKDQELLTWAAQHITVWAGQGTPPDIGITSDQVADASTKLSAAQTALSDADTIRQQSAAKTADKDLKVGDLRSTLGGLVTQIEGYAKATGDQGVYVRAEVPEPKPKTPRTEAPIPQNLGLRNTTNGNLVLTFEANKGQGSVFVIQRRTKPVGGTAGDFQYQDTSAEKTWTDASVPTGLEWVSYQVATKLTNGVLSDWSTARTFNFGSVGESPATEADGPLEFGGGEPLAKAS